MTLAPDDIDRTDPATKHWCSGVRRGPICAHGFKLQILACAPHGEEMAAEYIPPCCTDSHIVKRTSGRPVSAHGLYKEELLPEWQP